jgi:hypothetical protein
MQQNSLSEFRQKYFKIIGKMIRELKKIKELFSKSRFLIKKQIKIVLEVIRKAI